MSNKFQELKNLRKSETNFNDNPDEFNEGDNFQNEEANQYADINQNLENENPENFEIDKNDKDNFIPENNRNQLENENFDDKNIDNNEENYNTNNENYNKDYVKNDLVNQDNYENNNAYHEDDENKKVKIYDF